ncbi:MAG TPA: hypothetical protein VFG11_02600 [Acidobacteriota bacterium]|nr:hypothetical protein [Acidobacteriota bacterium]
MPGYESTQTVVGFLRRLAAGFTGFNPIDGAPQILMGQANYRNTRIDIRVITRGADQQDVLTLSIPMFALPETRVDSLFRRLLFWNNGATDTLRFVLDETSGKINLLCLRPVLGLAFEEFQYTLSRMAEIAKDASIRLSQDFGLKTESLS